jgi:DNA-binding CsgD family transcriptional regulator
MLLVFPLSVIVGNLRYFDLSIALAGFQSLELTFFFLGLGWLIAALIPQRLFIPAFRCAAIVSAVLVFCLAFMSLGLGRVALYMAFQFLNGLCAAFAFYLFCFTLNNVERLLGMALIQLYYGLFYITWKLFSPVYALLNSWGGIGLMAVYLIIVFLCRAEKQETNSDTKSSGIFFAIGLTVIHYMITCLVNYIEWSYNGLSATAFGTGTLVAIVFIVVIQLLKGHSALYIWLLFLVLSLLGLGTLLYDTPLTFIFGSFAYGLGDSLGYIIVYYICAGVIKKSKSMRVFRMCSLVFFVKYGIIAGLFSLYFDAFDSPNKFLAFGIVLVLVCLCFLLLPLMQKRLFEADWTDGLYLGDMEEYSKPFAQTEELNTKDKLNLTPREEEIFTMLLTGSAPKEIAHTLKISAETVHFHQKNLYRKLGIQSRAELFARFSSMVQGKNDQ